MRVPGGRGRSAVMLGLSLLAMACSSPVGFYLQAARGGLGLQLKAKPISTLLAGDDLPAELRERLELVVEMRDFGGRRLGLETAGSYRQYAELGRDSVVWNVVAAPPLALEAKRWCYPVAGCVTYRGYFRERAARRFARRVEGRGFDVSVGGVRAYSTLGKLSDPVLDTFLFLPEAELAATLFHELAHITFYAAGDTGFNESLATVVEAHGVERWLGERQLPEMWVNYRERRALDRRFNGRLLSLRTKLAEVYESSRSESDKLELKQTILDGFTADVKREADIDPALSGWASWVDRGLDNADLAAVGAYWEWVPRLSAELEFRGWAAFAEWVRELVELSTEERSRVLGILAQEGAT